MAATTKGGIAARLAEARERTLMLVEPLEDEQLNRVYSPILSPLAWDLGHIANFEELWLVQTIGGREPMHGELGRFYDAIENPRRTRSELPILRGDELRSYMDEVRERSLDVLDEVDLDRRRGPAASRRLRLRDADRPRAPAQRDDAAAPPDGRGLRAGAGDRRPAAEPVAEGPEMVGVAAASRRSAPPARLRLRQRAPAPRGRADAFEIDRAPVTNAAFADFIAETGAEPPLYWERDGEAAG